MRSLLPIAATLLTLAISGPTQAASSDWFEMQGASIRLVTAGRPDAEGRLKGMLDIRLKPGWKTYWRDPGDAGVPPTIDVSENANLAGAEFHFPAPQRHDDDGLFWAGYSQPVGLPIVFTLRDAAGPARIVADIFLGVCETICVPVQATLSVDPARAPENADHDAALSAAFEGIPAPATADFGVEVAAKPDDAKVVLKAAFPGDPDSADLFLAGEDGYFFTTPVREVRDGQTFFSVEATRPDKTPAGAGIHYTLVTDKGAVSGLLPYF